MKCPNCGMDIVIATHLCPHCGYAHDFDGAIEPRRDLPEPWDLTPDTTRRCDRHEREARFRAARREDRARRDALRREAGVYVRDERVREARESRSRDGEKVGRIWVVTRNLVLASLALCALLLLGAAAFYVTGAYFELDGRYTGSYAYWVLPELRYLDTVFGAACAVTALVVVAALAALRRGKRAGSGLVIFAAVLFGVARFAYAVALTAAFDLGSGLLASSGDWFIPLVLYVVFVQLIIRKNPALRAEEGT